MQNALYMTDSYLKEFEATVESVKDDKFVVLSQTAFYPKGGGQEHDTGALLCNGEEYPVVFAGKFDGKISHEVSKPGLKAGDKVIGKIDWDRRYRHPRPPKPPLSHTPICRNQPCAATVRVESSDKLTLRLRMHRACLRKYKVGHFQIQPRIYS